MSVQTLVIALHDFQTVYS